jgi:hypothetical protein
MGSVVLSAVSKDRSEVDFEAFGGYHKIRMVGDVN